MTTLTNGFEGGTNGTTITTGNSGGTSGNALDAVAIGTSATAAFDTTLSAHGGVSAKFATGATTTTSLIEWTTSEGTQTTIYYRLYAYLTASASPGIRPCEVRSGASHAASVLFNGTTLSLSFGAGFSGTTAFTTPLPLNQWFRIEGFFTGDATAGVVSASLYTSMDALAPTETHTFSGLNTVGTLTQYWFGQANSSASSGPFWLDDIGISSTGPLGPATVFPDAPLGVMVEVDAGGWQDISPYVAIADAAAITITYGRADASTQTNPTTAAMKWSNVDGRFSPRNPLGPYYPSLGRNTPVRVSIPSDDTYLRFADDNDSFASTPDSVGLSITGDLELQFDLDLQNYTASLILSKWTTSQQSWAVFLDSSGLLHFQWSPTGSNQFAEETSLPVPVGRTAWKITFQASTGTVTFYTAATIGGSWTQFGDAKVFGTSTSIHDSTAPVVIGAESTWPNNPGQLGRVYAVKILSGIGGTAKASPDFTTATVGASTLTDAQGNVWTLSGTAGFSARDYLFYGECAALPQQWDRDDIWTPVSAAGVLRRIGQSTATLDSPMKRGYLHLTTPPIAYWPCEDGTQAQQIAAAIGGNPMAVSGTAQFASNNDFVCSAALPVVNGSAWSALVPPYSGGTDIVYRFLMEVPTAGETDGDRIARIHTSGTVRTFTLVYKAGGGLECFGYDSSGNQLFDSGINLFGVNGERLRVSMELRTSGSNVAWSVVTMQPGASSGLGMTGTVAGSVGHATQVYINPGFELNTTTFGHVSVENVWVSLFGLASEFNGFRGEAAGDRFARLCGEEGLNCRVYGPSSLTRIMGAQSIDTLIDLLQECEDADNGMIFEPLDTLGLGYRTLLSMSAQGPAVALDYAADHVSPPLSPTDDDLYTANDITASRPDGSSARAFLDDGSFMSVANPPVGVGSYVTFATVNVNMDAMLNDNANWLLHLGTVNEERYPEVKVDLAATSPAIVALFSPVIDTRVGDMVTVDNLPAFLPPDGISALVWGSVLTIGDFVCNVVWQTQPASPYNVLVAGASRANTNGSTLHANVTTTATSITVDTQAGSALWTTSSGDWPFDILVGGERMTVTHISGTSGTQTFTVTRSVNGIVKAHLAGDDVNLFSPSFYALT